MNDVIYRQAAIDAVAEGLKNTFIEYRDVAEKMIGKLPSAQQEQKTGEWIGTEYDGYADGNPVYYEWECSKCGCIIEEEERPTYNYCPQCGADMRGKADADD